MDREAWWARLQFKSDVTGRLTFWGLGSVSPDGECRVFLFFGYAAVGVSNCEVPSCCGAQALGTWASVVAVHGLRSCDIWAYLLRSLWNLPGPGIELVSPALAGGFLTTVPPGKSSIYSKLDFAAYLFL